MTHGLPVTFSVNVGPNNAVYRGETCDQKIHGFGTLEYDQGNCHIEYTGNYRHGEIHGLGTKTVYVRTQSKQQKYSEYTGEFKHNRYHGFGKVSFFNAKGHVTFCSTGYFRDGHYHGYTESVRENGELYFGYMLHKERHGFGTTVCSRESYKIREQGFYQHNVLHGYGHQEFKNGGVYTGNFVQGRFQGLGILVKQNKVVYNGLFHNDQFQHGHVTSVNGKWTYAGSMQNGLRHGFGKLKTAHYTFEGQFANGAPTIHCKLTTTILWMHVEWADLRKLHQIWALQPQSLACKQTFHTALLQFWGKIRGKIK